MWVCEVILHGRNSNVHHYHRSSCSKSLHYHQHCDKFGFLATNHHFLDRLLSTGCGWKPSLCQFSVGFHVVSIAVNLVRRFSEYHTLTKLGYLTIAI